MLFCWKINLSFLLNVEHFFKCLNIQFETWNLLANFEV